MKRFALTDDWSRIERCIAGSTRRSKNVIFQDDHVPARAKADVQNDKVNGGIGHKREIQGLHSLTAAFEDEADPRTLFFMLG